MTAAPDRYFAYGSNMSLARLRARLPEAERIGTARLPGYRLAFHKQSRKDGSAKCDAFRTGQDEDVLWGVVWHIATSSWPLLDEIEGTGRGYERETLEVFPQDGEPLMVQLYIATLINPDLVPMDWYRQHVLHGARENNLPPDYIDAIAAVPAQQDPDTARRARELAIHRH